LQLHQLGLKFAVPVAHQAKIYLHKHGMGRLIRHFELRGHSLVRLRAVGGILDQLPDQFFAILSHPVEQHFGKKARSLRQPELHAGSAFLVDAAQERLVFLGSKVLVELLSQGGNHRKGDGAEGLLANLHAANELTFQRVEMLDHSIQQYLTREIADHLVNAN